MKEKIKKFGLLSIIFVILIGVAGFSYYKYQEKQEQERLFLEIQEQNFVQKQNYLFAKDVVRSLIYVNTAFRENEIKDVSEKYREIQFLVKMYATKEELLNAKNIMEQWSDHENIQISEISNDMLRGINDLIASNEAGIRIGNKDSVSIKQDLAIFQVKLEQGRNKIFIAPVDIGLEFSLSDSQKKNLIFYIETNFEEEVIEYKKQVKKGEEPTIRAEAAAALIIKGGLEGLGTDLEKVMEDF